MTELIAARALAGVGGGGMTTCVLLCSALPSYDVDTELSAWLPSSCPT